VGNTPEPTDADGTGRVGAATAEAPTSSLAPAEPTVLDRVRSALAGSTPGRVVGWLLVIGWVGCLAALWVTQPRLVPQDVLAEELARGHATAYRVVTVDEDAMRGPFSGPYRIDVYPASDTQDGIVDGAADGQPVTVAYWVDSPVAGLRVLDPNGLSSDTPAGVVASLQAAGVPEADASVFFGGLPSERVTQAGALLLMVSTLVVIFGPRPRRGTRWFWFWVVGGPLSLGVPVFAVAELLRPRYELEGTVHPPGVAGRWSGLAGFAIGCVLSIVGTGALLALNAESPIWFIRG